MLRPVVVVVMSLLDRYEPGKRNATLLTRLMNASFLLLMYLACSNSCTFLGGKRGALEISKQMHTYGEAHFMCVALSELVGHWRARLLEG